MSNRTTSESHLCEAASSCLVILDVQTKLTAAMPNKVLSRLKKNSALLIKSADILGIPVLATRQYPEGLGPLAPEIEEVLPKQTKYFDKTCFSCAKAENFIDEIRANNRIQVILAGLEAHICVLQTAIDLLESGFKVFVVVDAVCSQQRENYETALQRLRQAGIITSNTESVLFEWIRDSRHEHFKMISALVR